MPRHFLELPLCSPLAVHLPPPPAPRAAVIKAINDIVIDGLSLGTYGSLTGGYFSTDRTQGSCAAYLQQQQQLAVGDILTPLSFNQLAGIFFVLVLGAGASLVVWGLFMIAAKMDSKKLAAQGVNTVRRLAPHAHRPPVHFTSRCLPARSRA